MDTSVSDDGPEFGFGLRDKETFRKESSTREEGIFCIKGIKRRQDGCLFKKISFDFTSVQELAPRRAKYFGHSPE